MTPLPVLAILPSEGKTLTIIDGFSVPPSEFPPGARPPSPPYALLILSDVYGGVSIPVPALPAKVLCDDIAAARFRSIQFVVATGPENPSEEIPASILVMKTTNDCAYEGDFTIEIAEGFAKGGEMSKIISNRVITLKNFDARCVFTAIADHMNAVRTATRTAGIISPPREVDYRTEAVYRNGMSSMKAALSETIAEELIKNPSGELSAGLDAALQLIRNAEV
jgi:hypothetical protein